jgi:hypothetical protein
VADEPPEEAGEVVEDFVVPVPTVVAGVVPVAFGVTPASGIFGGFTVVVGSAGFTVVGVPRLLGGVTAAPGDDVAPGAAGAAAGGTLCATVVLTTRGFALSWFSAAYAAAAAPKARIEVAARTVAPERQPPACVCRLPGAPRPQ